MMVPFHEEHAGGAPVDVRQRHGEPFFSFSFFRMNNLIAENRQMVRGEQKRRMCE